LGGTTPRTASFAKNLHSLDDHLLGKLGLELELEGFEEVNFYLGVPQGTAKRTFTLTELLQEEADEDAGVVYNDVVGWSE